MKKIICLLFIFVIVFSSSAYAEDVENNDLYDLTEKYSLFVSNQFDEELETLTFEEAQKKALRNNSSIKKLSASIKLAENSLSIQYTDAMADSGENFSSLISFLNSKSSYENNELSKLAQQESVKHSMKESYINIIKSQREISLAETALKKDELNINISKTKLENGKISQSEYDSLVMAYNNSKENLENKKKALELNYVSLNIIMGVDVSNRYNFVMEAVYEPFELNIPVESYINGKVTLSNSVKQSKKTYETTKQTSAMSPINSTEINSYQTAQNNLNSAEMSYEDTKDSVYQSLYQKYNSINQNESNYASSVEELDMAKRELERTEVKYSNGKASYYELINAQYVVAEKENSILNYVYEHMLLVEEFTNTDLM